MSNSQQISHFTAAPNVSQVGSKKRGRPRSNDEASLNPKVAIQRERERNKRQQTRERAKQRKATEEAQTILAQTLARASLIEQQEQASLATAISTNPWRPSGDLAPLSVIPEGEPAPAVFEGARIQGIGGLPESEWVGFEDEDDEDVPPRERQLHRAATSKVGAKSHLKGKGKQRAATPGSVSPLVSWLTRPSTSIPPEQPDRSSEQTTSCYEDQGFDSGADEYWAPDDDNVPLVNTTDLDEDDQIAAAIMLSIRDEKQRELLPDDREENVEQQPTRSLGSQLLSAFSIPQVAESSARAREIQQSSTIQALRLPSQPSRMITQEASQIATGRRHALATRAIAGHATSRSELVGPESGVAIGTPVEHGQPQDESGASEHDEDDDPERLVIEKILDSWYGDFPGCTHEEHDAALTEHEALVPDPDNHFALDEMFTETLPYNALHTAKFLTAEDIETAGGVPDPATLASIYCGINPGTEDEAPRRVCLHKQTADDSPLDASSDIDSYCGIADTLAIALGGIDLQTAANEQQNIKVRIHGHVTIPDGEFGDHLELRDIPHQFAGRLGNDHKVSLWILYPQCPRGNHGKFTRLTDEQLTHWNNEIWLPVLYAVLPGHALQDLPSSYRDADNKARARQLERRIRAGGAYDSKQQIVNHIQYRYLHQITVALRERVQLPAHQDFRGFQIYFCAKGVKNEFKTTSQYPRLQDSMTSFLNHLRRTLARDLIPWERFWIDIGREHCVTASYIRGAPPTPDQAKPQVFLPRRCCMQKYHDWYYKHDEKAFASSTNLYTGAMLGDTASLTTTPPLSSKMRQGGLIYSQIYPRVKTMLEASKIFVNEQDGIEELALDPNIAAGLYEGAGGRARQIPVLERAYCAGKQRLRQALYDNQYKSYAIRQEHRITLRCFLSMWDMLDVTEDTLVNPETVSRPSFIWAIPTPVYTQYLRQHAGKFLTGFETIRAQSSQQAKSWEETKMMTMFLRCLRYATGNHQIAREAALWSRRKEYDDGRNYHGLDFEQATSQSRYCWIRKDLIDWQQLQFRLDMTDEVVFSNKSLIGKVLKRGRRLRYFFNESKQIDVALAMLRTHPNNDRIRTRSLQFLAHLTLRQFRTDIWAKIQHEVIQEPGIDRTNEKLGDWFLCFDVLHQLYGREPHLISGNRSSNISVQFEARFIFDVRENNRHKRKGWSEPWVKFLRRTYELLQLEPDGNLLSREFSEVFFEVFFNHHWLLPRAHKDGLLQTTKFRGSQERPWVSIICDVEEVEICQQKGQLPVADCYSWGGKERRHGQPQPYPEYIEWDQQQWEDFVIDATQNASGDEADVEQVQQLPFAAPQVTNNQVLVVEPPETPQHPSHQTPAGTGSSQQTASARGSAPLSVREIFSRQEQR